MPKISPKHALTDEEIDFCRRYAAFGFTQAPEAYRRAFLVRTEEGWMERDRRGNPKPPAMGAKKVSRLANQLLGQPYISAYLEQIGRPAGDSARSLLAEQVLFGNEDVARRAAERVLADEDKLGFRDAVERWAEIMCEIGAEVVVPLANGGEVVVPFHNLIREDYREGTAAVGGGDSFPGDVGRSADEAGD